MATPGEGARRLDSAAPAHAAKPIPSSSSLILRLGGVLCCTRALELCCCRSRLTRAQRLPQLNRRLLLLSALHKDALYAQPMPTPPRRRCTIALVTAGRCQLLQLIILARSGSRIAQPVQLVARKRGAADAAASPDVSFRPSVWSRAPGALPARRRRRQKRPFSPPFDTQLQHLSKHLLS